MTELLIGCGHSRIKRIWAEGGRDDWTDLKTLDIDPGTNPDYLWDLNHLPFVPFSDNQFDEIHAYEVLEHTGAQGDWRFFFAQFSEFWRILKPNGMLCLTSPKPTSIWAWGDPGHTRVISIEALGFLNQPFYEREIGVTCATDYRHIYSADFDLSPPIDLAMSFGYALVAIKPSRIKS